MLFHDFFAPFFCTKVVFVSALQKKTVSLTPRRSLTLSEKLYNGWIPKMDGLESQKTPFKHGTCWYLRFQMLYVLARSTPLTWKSQPSSNASFAAEETSKLCGCTFFFSLAFGLAFPTAAVWGGFSGVFSSPQGII